MRLPNGISTSTLRSICPDERELLCHPDPVGPENELHLLSAREVSLMTRLVLAWGKPFGGKQLAGHYKKALAILAAQKPYCLGVNNDGSPKHPLFLANATELIAWGRIA